MRKLSVLVALVTGASLFALLAPAANAIVPIPHASGSVSCANFSGVMTVTGKSLNNKHLSGPRYADFEVKNVACTTQDVSGTRENRSIDNADIKVKLPLASTTCDGLNTALTLGSGVVAESAKFKHDLVVLGHTHRITAATASGHKIVSAPTPGDSIGVPLVSIDFRGETATLTIASHTVHCDGKHKSTVSFTGSFAIG